MKNEIYSGRKKLILKQYEFLEKMSSTENKELIHKFKDHLFVSGSHDLRITKLIAQMRIIVGWLEELGISKPLSQLSKDDLVSLIAYIGRLENKSENTKADYRRAIRQFYNWFEDEDKRNVEDDIEALKFYKYIKKNVKIGYKEPQVDPKTIITDEDIVKVINKGASSVRDVALISLLHETGMRADELLNLKVGSIYFKKNVGVVNVPPGKTGRRVNHIVKSVPYVQRHIDIHPEKENPEAFLFLTSSTNHRHKPLRHRSCTKLIHEAFEKARVNKKHNLHWFRHSRATILAPELTESVLCKVMGWQIGSKQVRRYIHLCVEQIEDALMKYHGLKKEKEKEIPIACHCGTTNVHNARYCTTCSSPLSTTIAIQDKERIDEQTNSTMLRMLALMQKDPELMKQYRKIRSENARFSEG